MKKYVRFKRIILLVFAVLIALTGTGCLNPTAIDNLGYVVTVGVDKGTDKKYEVTLELQRGRSGEGGDDEGGAIILSAQGDTLFEVISVLNWGVPRQLNFTRTHVFLFSEELARSGGMKDFLAMSFDMLRIRESAIIMVTHSTAKEFIGGLSANEHSNISKIQEDLTTDMTKSGQIRVTDVTRFFQSCEGRRFDTAVPMGYYEPDIITDAKQQDSSSKGENPLKDAPAGARVGGSQSLVAGAALFDGWTMTGILDAYETQLLNLGSGKFNLGTINTTLDGEIPIALYISMKKYSVKVDLSAEEQITVDLYIGLSVQQDATNLIGHEWETVYRKKFTEYFENELNRVFDILKKANCDAMEFGKYALTQFKTVEEWEKFNWKEYYRRVKVDFNVNLNLDDTYVAMSGK